MPVQVLPHVQRHLLLVEGKADELHNTCWKSNAVLGSGVNTFTQCLVEGKADELHNTCWKSNAVLGSGVNTFTQCLVEGQADELRSRV